MLIRIALFLVALLPLASCGKPQAPKNEKPTVLVSVPPYIYFVDKIAHGLVAVEPLVPAGANPHIYEATPKEVQRHQNAAMWFYLGESLDKKVLRVLRETRNQIRIVDVAQKIDLLSYCNEEEHHDHCH